MNRADFLRAVLAATVAGPTRLARAQSSPPVKLLVGFAAGGPVDVVARAFADQLRQSTGAPVLVENRAGASGKLAIDALLAAPADATALLVAPASLLELTPLVLKTANYDADRDFMPLGSLAEYGWAVAAGPACGATTLAGYRAWARAHPGRSSFASPGQGTPQHFLGAQLRSELGIELAHVPYRGGAAAITDVLGGQVPLIVATEQLLVPYQGGGKLNMLLTTSRDRNPLLSGVPTAREAGLAQLEATDWMGLFARTGTPPDKARAWQAELARVVASAGYQEAMRKLGYAVARRQPADLVQQMRIERTAWAQRVKLSGFKPSD